MHHQMTWYDDLREQVIPSKNVRVSYVSRGRENESMIPLIIHVTRPRLLSVGQWKSQKDLSKFQIGFGLNLN